jgi:hypothetical protein
MSDVADAELGPIDYIVVEFPAGAKNFTGEMAKELASLVDAGTVRVLDLLILEKHENGDIESYEIEDVEHLAAAMEPGSTAGVLVWENTWAAPFAVAARKSGGQLIAGGRIPTQALIAAFESDPASTEGE